MTLRAVLDTIRRNLILAVVVLVVCTLGGAAVALLQPDRYETSTEILFQPASSDASGSSDSATSSGTSAMTLLQAQLPTYAALAGTATVLDPVAKQLGTSSVALQDRVSASVVADTSIITISASAPTAEGAAELANAVGTSLISQVRELDPTGTGTTSVTGSVVEAPVVPTASSTVGPLIGGLIGLVVGLVLAYLVVLAREALAAPGRRVAAEREQSDEPAREPLPVTGTLERA